MPSYLLSVTATNLDRVLFDTTDLSTARGGSLAALFAAPRLVEPVLDCHAPCAWSALRIGASEALYQVRAEDDRAAVTLRDKVAAALRRADQPRDDPNAMLAAAVGHLTFSIALVREPHADTADDGHAAASAPDPLAAAEACLAATRWQQMQAPSLALPRLGDTGAEAPCDLICAIDRWRPAAGGPTLRARDAAGNTVETPISRSVADRRRYGVVQKQALYRDLLRPDLDGELTALGAPPETSPLGQVLAVRPELGDRNALRRCWLDHQGGAAFLEPPSCGTTAPASVEAAPGQDAAETGEPPDAFAYDLHQIAKAPENAEHLRRLNGKIAVLYADGNQFGAIQHGLLRRAAAWGAEDTGRAADGRVAAHDMQRAIDVVLRCYRTDLLARIMVDAQQQPALWVNSIGTRKVIRFETLIWGGDEVLWVMPAWLGLRVADLFMRRTVGLAHRGPAAVDMPDDLDDWDRLVWDAAPRNGHFWHLAGTPMHHAVGLVFCSAKAAIGRITDAAMRLADLAKAADRGRSMMAIETLESFDHLGLDPAAARQQHCPRGMTADQLLIDGAHWPVVLACLTDIRNAGLPRRRLRRLVNALFTATRDLTALEEQFFADLPLTPDALGALKARMARLASLLPSRRAMWLHLETLWDYVPTVDAATAGGADASG